jgi:hydroxymethylglutaryl-CoA synthase
VNFQQLGAGISGMSVYLPPLRVPLVEWCDWTGNSWDKISAVVGSSFRCAGPRENVYTMAATAALRLIRQYELDPREVGFFALGTESSTDNAAGAVIVRGMLDRELERAGLPRLARTCEVPEFKHACLGGIYALKGAVRYVQSDGQGRSAIVVCADIAEYERGTSGEPTQGAGAVAMLVEREARMLRVDLARSGSASDYRGPDFRKPMTRHFHDCYRPTGVQRFHDFPVFSGRYSTTRSRMRSTA